MHAVHPDSPIRYPAAGLRELASAGIKITANMIVLPKVHNHNLRQSEFVPGLLSTAAARAAVPPCLNPSGGGSGARVDGAFNRP